MPSFPHIAIAILNYNGKKFLEAYLRSVLSVTYSNFSVWVIDNQSSDDSISFLKQNFPSVKIVSNGGNLGFAKGYNEGLKKIEADYYLLLNSDVEVSPGFVSPVIELMESDKEIAFVQPKIKSLKEPTSFEYAGAAGGMIDTLGYPFCRGRIFNTVEKDKGQYDENVPVFWGSGAALFARAETYRELGGMYEYFFMHNEEIDLCWRALNRKYKVMYCGQSVVYHLGGGSLTAESPQKTFFNFRNNYIMVTRNTPVGSLLWLIPLRVFMDSVAAIQFLASGNPKNALAVFKAMLKYAGWLLFHSEKQWPVKRGIKGLTGVYNGSIVWEYFMGKKKRLEDL